MFRICKKKALPPPFFWQKFGLCELEMSIIQCKFLNNEVDTNLVFIDLFWIYNECWDEPALEPWRSVIILFELFTCQKSGGSVLFNISLLIHKRRHVRRSLIQYAPPPPTTVVICPRLKKSRGNTYLKIIDFFSTFLLRIPYEEKKSNNFINPPLRALLFWSQ